MVVPRDAGGGGTVVAGGAAVPAGLSPVVGRTAKYGTPIEAPSNDAMMSGRDIVIASGQA
jgi:hypothetical protein